MTVVHIVGIDVMIDDCHRRQRCGWCGALLADDDFSRMAWPLNEDGTNPGPPPPWPVGALLEVDGELGDFRMAGTVRAAPESGSDPEPIPANCCARIDPDVTR